MNAEKTLESTDINRLGLDAQELSGEALQEGIKKAVSTYRLPESPLLRERLEWFKDQKFGLMVHWGLYNQMGIKESWPLVDRATWAKWQFKPGTTNREVKEMYAQLHKGFLPLRFDPAEWADIAHDAGFRYLCFTVKHHDGFCMWDTATTDYKVTGSEVPWRGNKYADITKCLFDAFRAKQMGISLYYSRADFSCPYYWEEGYAMRDGTARVPSYDPDEKPEVWKRYQELVFAQLKELVENYGRIDCLWYDGGCCGNKLGLPEMTESLREIQPGMLGVIRENKGICEDIITPELTIPNAPLDVPWEACTVMGKPVMEYGQHHVSFGYTYDQDYMSAKEIAHLLLDVVAKGGNLALNLAPQPDGRLPHRAVLELEVLSAWMRVFGPAIYGTRAVRPYRAGQYAYTASKDQKTLYAFYLYGDGACVPATHCLPVYCRVRHVTDLRSGCSLPFSQEGNVLHMQMPEGLIGSAGDIADCLVLGTED